MLPHGVSFDTLCFCLCVFILNSLCLLIFKTKIIKIQIKEVTGFNFKIVIFMPEDLESGVAQNGGIKC